MYRCEVFRDGAWEVYRDGQRFNSTDAARRLLSRLMDRYGEQNVRLAFATDWAHHTVSP